jgi:predicted amidohydrolase YtcJ
MHDGKSNYSISVLNQNTLVSFENHLILSPNKINMKKIRPFFILLLISVFIINCQQDKTEKNESADKSKYADEIYINGKVYTVDESQEWAEAFAVKDGKFIKVGSSKDIEKLKGANTKVVDLQGKFVMPGMIDAHNHAMDGSEDRANLSIKNPNNVDSILSEIKTYIENNPNIEVVKGGSWNLGLFPNDNPHKSLLDSISMDIPIYLMSQSGHSAWVNSKTLELAGITKDTKQTTKFIFSTDPKTGEPTGRVDEFAMLKIQSVIPQTDPNKIVEGMHIVQNMFNSYGITSSLLAEGREQWAKALKIAEEQNKLTMRYMLSWEWGAHSAPFTSEKAEEYALEWKDKSSDFVDFRSIKIFYDGSMDNYTALMLDDYVNEPGNKGFSHRTKEEFLEGIIRINKNGIGVIVHVMGDGSANELVSIFEEVQKINQGSAPLHFSHAVQARSQDLKKLANIPHATVDFSPALGVIAPALEVLFKNPVGENRYLNQFNVRSTMEANVPTGFGSDWPSSLIPEPNTFWYLETWVTRKMPGDSLAKAHNEKEKISLKMAIKGYTMGSAQCMGFDWPEKIGSITEGKYADFIILDQNLFEIAETEIHATLVEQTYLNGKIVFDRVEEQKKLEINHFEVTDEKLRNATAISNLNILVNEMQWTSHQCLVPHKQEINFGSYLAKKEINTAFSKLGNDLYKPHSNAFIVEWENEYFWIQWMTKNGKMSLWAYENVDEKVIQILEIKN